MNDSYTSSTSSRLVLTTFRLDERWVKRIQELSPDLHIEQRHKANVNDIPNSIWQDVEVLYTLNTLPSPEQAPKLRWVQLYSAGANQAFESALWQTPVIFTTASGVHAVNIGEYVLTMMLAWYHHFPRMLEWQQRGQWPADNERALFMPGELRGKTLNVVGYGSIGRQVARLAKAFGMRIITMGQRDDHRDQGFIFPDVGDPEGNIPDHYYRPDEFHKMLGESDVIVAAVPLTEKTKGMFDEAAFRAMKNTAFFINIARGDICDEPALIRALEEKRIAGAALDVFHDEPLPSSSRLFHLPNVFMSPHISGLTPQYDERAAAIFTENLRCYLHGETLYNVVDIQRGY